MKIDAFITCVGENARKFLTITLGFNKKFFDSIYIITTPEDLETQKLCESAGVDCLVTDLFFKEFQGCPSKFNRGAVINKAIEIVKPDNWICSMDCDILIKDDFLKWKNNYDEGHHVNPTEIFWGMSRFIIPTMGDLLKFFNGGKKEEEFVSYPGCGWGYFQLWNVNGQPVKNGLQYPDSHDSAESDWKWRNLWGETINGDTQYTGNLREIPVKCAHLGEPNIEKNQNFWD